MLRQHLATWMLWNMAASETVRCCWGLTTMVHLWRPRHVAFWHSLATVGLLRNVRIWASLSPRRADRRKLATRLPATTLHLGKQMHLLADYEE